MIFPPNIVCTLALTTFFATTGGVMITEQSAISIGLFVGGCSAVAVAAFWVGKIMSSFAARFGSLESKMAGIPEKLEDMRRRVIDLEQREMGRDQRGREGRHDR